MTESIDFSARASSFSGSHTSQIYEGISDGRETVGLLEFLECDPLPTFAIDLTSITSKNDHALPISISNLAYRSFSNLGTHWAQNKTDDAEYLEFSRWACAKATNIRPEDRHIIAGCEWTRGTLRSRWRIIRGYPTTTASRSASMKKTSASRPSAVSRTSSDKPLPSLPMPRLPTQERHGDWTAPDAQHAMSDHERFLHTYDWEATELGALSSWTPELRRSVNFLVADPRPASLIWGPNRLVSKRLFSYKSILGKRHPSALGRRFADIYPEIPKFHTLFSEIDNTGRAITQDNAEYYLERDGIYEEGYYSLALIPIHGAVDNRGIYNPIAERRMATLVRAGEKIAGCIDIETFFKSATQALQRDEHDIPFAAVYSVYLNEDSETLSISSEGSGSTRSYNFIKSCALEGSIRLPEGHPARQDHLDLSHGTDGFVPYFRKCASSGAPLPLHLADGSLSADLLQGITCPPFGDPCRSVVICPIKPTTGAENIAGFFLLGLNPRRSYDEDYSIFISLLCRMFATSLASATLLESEIRRGRNAAEQAAVEQAKLEEELALKAQQAERYEMQFTHFADGAPIGMFKHVHLLHD
ncbi:hypothetical protein MRB53_041201 [Persea americana]|nr:hypothetical protein MRB53_041201 [Persea americana]